MLSKLLIFAALLAVGASAAAPVAISPVKAPSDFYFSSQSVTFLQAWAYCKNSGLRFLSVPSVAQNDAVATALDELGAPATTFWIGGLYIQNGFLTKWFWVDGEEDFNYVNWASTPSPSPTADNCVYYNYVATTKKGNWGYGPCTGARYFICHV